MRVPPRLAREWCECFFQFRSNAGFLVHSSNDKLFVRGFLDNLSTKPYLGTTLGNLERHTHLL